MSNRSYAGHLQDGLSREEIIAKKAVEVLSTRKHSLEEGIYIAYLSDMNPNLDDENKFYWDLELELNDPARDIMVIRHKKLYEGQTDTFVAAARAEAGMTDGYCPSEMDVEDCLEFLANHGMPVRVEDSIVDGRIIRCTFWITPDNDTTTKQKSKWFQALGKMK